MDTSSINIPPELIQSLNPSLSVAVLTGAGISAESGVKTFREAQTGLWSRYDPSQLATPEAFKRDPQLVWEWYTWRRELISVAQPNPGHFALVEMGTYFSEFTLITQNVDGLHRRAGSRSLIELHGDISRTKCSIENVQVSKWSETGEIPPRCPRCGGQLRPDVVWFGENLPEKELKNAFQVASSCQLFFSIGTSSLIEPAASLPFHALQKGAKVIEINIDQTPLTANADWHLSAPAGQVLPVLVEELNHPED
jgi:NAD-dependent deacetylase